MKKAFRVILLLLLSLCLLVSIPLFAFLYITRDCTLDGQKLQGCEQNVVILDAFGEEIESISSCEHKSYVQLKNIPNETIQAFLSIEDKRFYRHNGINQKRMVKALIENIKTRSFQQGASTISQQLIKNTHLSGEKTIKRKLKEIRLTLLLEQNYTKDEILELYLNTIYFGHSTYGIGNASKYYFGKNPDALTVSEGAMLAGLLQSPNRYSPFKNPEKCLARRNLVLSEMEKDGIMPDIIEKAKAEPLPKTPFVSEENPYLDLVFEELDELLEMDSLPSGTLSVTTGFDRSIQKELPLSSESDQILCVTNNETGLIQAYHSTVGKIRRLPGSVIKPLLVYAPAIEEDQITPITPICDEKITFGDYAPSNYNDVYRGYISVKEALAFSSNIPAIKILNNVGIENAKKYLAKMDLKTEENNLALALGGMKDGYTLLQLINGYSVFSHQGKYLPYKTIERIENNGKIIYTNEKKTTQVFSEETIELMNEMMNYTSTHGTAKKLSVLPFETYAKTGTVGGQNGNTDAYSITYTSRHTVGIWLGNANYSPIEYTGGGVPTETIKGILEALYEENPPKITPTGKIKKREINKIAYETEHKIELADPLSPKSERINASFKDGKEPKTISRYFSNPTISEPTIAYDGNKVTIKIEDKKYYSYRIERSSIHKYSLLYNDIQSNTIIDSDLSDDTTYLYTITPLCFGQEGEKISLPLIHTKAQKKETPTEPPISQKEWWNE